MNMTEAELANLVAKGARVIERGGKPISVEAEVIVAPKRKAPHSWGRMNKTEARYHARLAATKPHARIWFEAVTLKLGHDCRYTPDFMVQEPGLLGHSIAFHEVKGARKRDDAMVKLRVAASTFPLFAFYLCELVKGEWSVKLIPAPEIAVEGAKLNLDEQRTLTPLAAVSTPAAPALFEEVSAK